MRRLLAAIDLGTNTVRVLVAEADPATGLVPRWADQVVARLGEGVAGRETLAPAAADRALAAVRGYRDRARALGAAAWLAALPFAERARTPGLEPGRADVIVPGGIVLAAALAGLGLPAAVVSDAGLREGILLDAVGWRPSTC